MGTITLWDVEPLVRAIAAATKEVAACDKESYPSEAAIRKKNDALTEVADILQSVVAAAQQPA